MRLMPGLYDSAPLARVARSHLARGRIRAGVHPPPRCAPPPPSRGVRGVVARMLDPEKNPPPAPNSHWAGRSTDPGTPLGEFWGLGVNGVLGPKGAFDAPFNTL
jgi:hypothetical protein